MRRRRNSKLLLQVGRRGNSLRRHWRLPPSFPCARIDFPPKPFGASIFFLSSLRVSLCLSTRLLRTIAQREVCALEIRLEHIGRVYARRQGRSRAFCSVRELCEWSLGLKGVEKFVWAGFHVSERWRMTLQLMRPTTG